MPEHEFRLTGLVQTLENDTYLAEALFFPEVSCLGDDRDELCLALEVNAAHIVRALPPLDLYRRHQTGLPEVVELRLTLDAPARSVSWREPVELTLPVLKWAHGTDNFLVHVPALDIEIVAPTLDERERLLPLHVRAALLRRKRMRLADLVRLQRCRKLEIILLSFSVKLPTPRQRVADEEVERQRKKSTLKEIAVDLTEQDLSEAYEVQDLLPRLAEALTGRNPRSVLLVGPSGVGKTALVHELVRRRRDFGLGHTPFWATSGSRLVAGMSGFGMWQERCQDLWREASKAKAVLHMGNLMELVEVGKSEHHSQGIASFLRPYLGRGDLLVLVECTPEQLPLLERQDPHLLRVFAEVRVEEPSRERGQAILASYALHAALSRPAPRSELPIDPDALHVLDRLHRRYATYSAYPGRPLRFLRNLLADQARGVLTAGDITAAFSRETGLPLFLLEDSVRLHLAEARQWFGARVIGQAEAVDLVYLLATVKARLTRPRKPIASLMFIGPTGVGKTEMAKALAEFLFGSRQRLTRFDMSEYADPLAVQRLIGGTISSEGLLTAKVREQPFSVILLDEFEKADPQLFDLLLQVLGEGRLTDSAGRLADFCNSVVIMTSNLGAASYQQATPGFGDRNEVRDHAREHFVREVQAFVRPEFFNRIDRVVPFAPLDEETILKIAHRQLELLQSRDGIRYRGVALDLAPEVSGWLARKGYDARYGARPLKRAIERELLAPLAEKMNAYAADTPLRVGVTLAGESLQIHVRARTDDGGRQAGAHGIDAASVETAGGCVELRRDVQRLERCSAVRELLNEIFRLERIEKRVREGKWVSPSEDTQRLGRLAQFRKLRDELRQAWEGAVELEDEALLRLHSQEALDHERLRLSLDEGRQRFNRLLRSLFVMRFDRPDEVTVAVFSEVPALLINLMAGYAGVVDRLGGAIDLWQFTPGREGRDEKSTPERRLVLEPSNALTGSESLRVRRWDRRRRTWEGPESWAAAWDGVVGTALAIRTPAANPLFAPESGLHQFNAARDAGKCLVDTSPLPMTGTLDNTFYTPPQGIERRGAIGNQARRRIYHPERSLVEDLLLGRKIAWNGGHLEVLLADLLEQRLLESARGLLDE
jgi:ATP-dependent Clp protease ATP-binding subunit ClpC